MISRRTIRALVRTAVIAFAMGCAYALPLGAQLPSASAPALGMADNYAALAKGLLAVSLAPSPACCACWLIALTAASAARCMSSPE